MISISRIDKALWSRGKPIMLALTAFSLLALAGCSQKVSRPACPAGKICLQVGNGSEPASLDPHKSTGTWEDRIISDLIVGLTTSDMDGKSIPGMAERWTSSPDGKTWTFYLRDAVWSDGVPVTADDFVFALRRILDPKTAAEYASLIYFIKNAQPVNEGKLPGADLGVRAVSPKVLEITLAGAQARGGEVGRRLEPAGPLRLQRPLHAEELDPWGPRRRGEEPSLL